MLTRDTQFEEMHIVLRKLEELVLCQHAMKMHKRKSIKSAYLDDGGATGDGGEDKLAGDASV